MKKLTLSLLAILLFVINSKAQSDTFYFNAQWKFIKKKEDAKYYRTSRRVNDSLYQVTDHFMNGTVQMTGFYSNPKSDEAKDKHGLFVYYNDKGIKTSEGVYVNGKKEKEWKYYFEDGALESVRSYKFFLLEGKAIYYDSASHNRRSEGSFTLGKRTGEWRFYYQNDSLSERLNYANGDLDGAIIVYDSLTRNIILEGAFAHNLKHGKWRTYYKDGRPKEEVNYLLGKENGELALYDSLTGEKYAGGTINDSGGVFTSYYPGTKRLFNKGYIDPKTNIRYYKYYDSTTGNLIKEASFLYDLPYGTWKYYYASNGKLGFEETFKNGVVEGEFILFDSVSVNKLTVGRHSNGLRVGEWKFYNSGDGKLRSVESYKKGRLHGDAITYDANGVVKSVAGYKNGMEHGESILYHEGTTNKWVVWNMKEDSLDGALYTYYPSGKMKRKEHYKNGTLETSVCYDELGNEVEYYPVRTAPEFDGDVMTYIGNSLRYPESAKAKSLEGKVLVRFAINESGAVSEAQVVEGFNKECEDEAIRVISQMPPWRPATMDGIPEKVYKTIPVVFWIH